MTSCLIVKQSFSVLQSRNMSQFFFFSLSNWFSPLTAGLTADYGNSSSGKIVIERRHGLPSHCDSLLPTVCDLLLTSSSCFHRQRWYPAVTTELPLPPFLPPANQHFDVQIQRAARFDAFRVTLTRLFLILILTLDFKRAVSIASARLDVPVATLRLAKETNVLFQLLKCLKENEMTI